MIREKEAILAKYTAAWGKRILCKDSPPLEECDAMILGSIMKSFESSKSATECRGMSILGLRDEIARLRLGFLRRIGCSSGYCSRASLAAPEANECPCRNRLVLRGSHSTTCSPVPELSTRIEGIISSIRGISLKDMKRIPVRGSKWEVVSIR